MSKTNFDHLLEEELSGPNFRRAFDESLRDWDVALRISSIRQSAGLTQKELAARVGTTQQVISRLESADYRGHSLSMLHRVAAALDARVVVDIQPLDKKARTTKRKATAGA